MANQTLSITDCLNRTAARLDRQRRRWLGIFIGWRLLLLALMLLSQATVLQKGQWTQYLYYRSVAELTDRGYYPLIGHWIEYPPLFPWLSAGLYRLAGLAATGTAKFVLFYGLLGLVFVAAECGVLVFLYKIAALLYNEQQAMVAALIFAVTALPTCIIYGWFDPIAAFFLFWGLERLLTGRTAQSALAAALGGLTKLFPLLLAAVGLRILPTLRQKGRYVTLVFLLTVGPILPFALTHPAEVNASVRWLLNKSTYQTVWAMVDGYYSFGIAPDAHRFLDVSAADWIDHPTHVPWNLVTAVFGLAGLYVYTRPMGANRKKGAVLLSGIIMQMMILYLKGFSPQYIIWFLPFVSLILPNGRGLLYSIALSALNALEFPIYFTFLEGQIAVLGGIIIARTLLCAVIAADYWRLYRQLPVAPLPKGTRPA